MSPVVLPHTVHGSGPHRVIALHGWFGDRTSFAPLLDHADGERFTYTTVDYRGYGEARHLDGHYTTAEIATDVLAVADRLGWDAFSLIGHSMGGKAAQHIIALAPQRVRSLVGISPVPASGTGFDEDQWAFFSSSVDDPAVRRAIISRTTGDRLPAAWLDAMTRYSLACSTAAAFSGYLRDWAGTDFHARVKDSPVPALVVAGAHDPELSAEVMRATLMTWFPNSTLRVLQEAGHYAMDETPLALLAAVEDFLAAVDSPTRN
ncbi:alpha/beta fold hydrolase [Streptomyces canus]|uniref:alpha/beta fold hydrolase n=1 Tax=Streptomyces canus TaxID=58343 RepID=UPI003711CE4F